MNILKKVICLYFVTFVAMASKVDEKEQNLVQVLFNTSRYDKRILPSVGQTGPLNIVVGLTIYRIEDLIEKDQQLVTHAVLHLSWNDPNLVWDQKQFGGIQDIAINSNKIWLPDIVLYNSAEEKFFSRKLGRIRPTIHYDGNVTMKTPVLLRTVCSVDVEDYPMDEQKCNLIFGSWGHHSEEIRVSIMSNKIDLRRYIVNGQWKIIETSLEQHLLFYGTVTKYGFYDVTFKITLRRRVLYYAMYLIIPGTLIALMSTLIFILPQDCSERITVGMAILVALSFFFLLVAENTPAASKVSIVGGYYTVTMIEMTISFFLNVLVLRFHHTTEEKVPHWVKKYILKHGAKILGMKFRVNNQVLENMKRRRFLLTRERKLRINVGEQKARKFPAKSLAEDKVIEDLIRTKIKLAEREAEWKKAAEVLNNYSLLLHLLVVLITFFVVFVKALLHFITDQHDH